MNKVHARHNGDGEEMVSLSEKEEETSVLRATEIVSGDVVTSWVTCKGKVKDDWTGKDPLGGIVQGHR